ncbi:pseudouridine synthase [Kiloniella sp. b19]|uniref:pseudouridine synthase n=1 Tax=Kiloniella sp. GXU_MW_B19 TaxID=3141326 RepID=UPI0031D2FF6D
MPRYIALYKPYDVLSQFTGDEGQKTLAAFGLPKGVYVAGRLDRDSEGLLLLSDDGPFMHLLMDPDFGHERSYWVQVEGDIGPEALEALRSGVEIKGGYQTRPCKVSKLEGEPLLPERNPPVRYRAAIPTSWIQMTLTEGKNRQVRRMTAAVGFPTLRLVRASIGRLTLNDFLAGLEPEAWEGHSVPIERQQILADAEIQKAYDGKRKKTRVRKNNRAQTDGDRLASGGNGEKQRPARRKKSQKKGAGKRTSRP